MAESTRDSEATEMADFLSQLKLDSLQDLDLFTADVDFSVACDGEQRTPVMPSAGAQSHEQQTGASLDGGGRRVPKAVPFASSTTPLSVEQAVAAARTLTEDQALSLIFLMVMKPSVAYDFIRQDCSGQNWPSLGVRVLVTLSTTATNKRLNNFNVTLACALHLLRKYKVIRDLFGLSRADAKSKFAGREYLYLDALRVGLYRLAADLTAQKTKTLLKELDELDDVQLEEAFLKMMAGGRLDHGKNLNDLAQRVERIQPDLRNYLPLMQSSHALGDSSPEVLKKGYCLIVSQENYRNSFINSPLAKEFDVRTGSSKDVERLEQTWKRFGCQVETLSDLTDEQLVRAVNERVAPATATKNFADIDYFVLVLMGHGDRGDDGWDRFYGVNGMDVKLEELILDKFIECKQLAGKLKLLIIQACRGEQRQPRVTIAHDGNANRTARVTKEVAANADFIKVFATVKNYAAWRLVSQGTFLIQLLCSEINSRAKHVRLREILRTTVANVKRETTKLCGSPQIVETHFAYDGDPFLLEASPSN